MSKCCIIYRADRVAPESRNALTVSAYFFNKAENTKGRCIFMSKSNRLYSIWCDMKKRCYNPNSKSYPHYGGRGIAVCEEWRNNFSAFESWSLQNGYSENLTIDRIDVNAGYCPSNCRWLSISEQQRNKRNNIYIEHNGRSLTIAEWSRELSINVKSLYSRYHSAIAHKGSCSLDDLLSTPSYSRIYTEAYANRAPRPSRKVFQCSKDGTVIAIITMNKLAELGYNRQAVINCCRGRAKTSAGYIWKYAD